MSIDVTICILTFNGEEFLNQLLSSVYNQRSRYSFEVLIIDSGSSDHTLQICKEFPNVRVLEIPNEDFGHGKTRNLAAQLCESEYIVFLTQDAVPSHDLWLDALLEPFELLENVSCVFGKQIPRSDCVAPIKREVDSVFNSFGDNASISIQRKSDVTKSINVLNTFMSDVNSAIKRKCLIEVPFQDLAYAEDQALGTDHLNRGWLKAYTPLGSVYHSHNYPLRKFYKRKIDERIGVYKATGETFGITFRSRVIGVISATLKDWIFIKRDREYSMKMKISNFIKSPLYNYALYKCYWLTRNPKNHEKLKIHSLEASMRSELKDG